MSYISQPVIILSAVLWFLFILRIIFIVDNTFSTSVDNTSSTSIVMRYYKKRLKKALANNNLYYIYKIIKKVKKQDPKIENLSWIPNFCDIPFNALFELIPTLEASEWISVDGKKVNRNNISNIEEFGFLKKKKYLDWKLYTEILYVILFKQVIDKCKIYNPIYINSCKRFFYLFVNCGHCEDPNLRAYVKEIFQFKEMDKKYIKAVCNEYPCLKELKKELNAELKSQEDLEIAIGNNYMNL